MPTNAHLQAMMQVVDSKADAEQVPSLSEFQASEES